MSDVKVLTPMEMAEEIKIAVSNERTRVMVNTEYLKSLRKSMTSKNEAAMLGQQIRKNKRDIEDCERHLKWLETYDGTFTQDKEDAAKPE